VSRRFACFALIFYAAALGVWAVGRSGPFEPPPLRALWDGSLSGAAGAWVAAALGAVALFVPVGYLAIGVVRRDGARVGAGRGLLAGLLALAIATAVLLFWPGRSWRLADAVTLLLALAGGTLGVLAGAAWTAGPGARAGLVWKLGAAAALVLAGAGALGYFSVEAQPLALSASPITSAEKRRIYYRVLGANPRAIRQGRTKTLRLSGRDLDVLASWAQTVSGTRVRAAASLGPGTVKVSSSLPLGSGGRRFLNTVLEVRPAVDNGRLALELLALRLGRVRVPRPVLAVLSPLVTVAIRNDERLEPFIAATRVLDVQPADISITYGRVDAPPGYVTDMFAQELTGEIDPQAVRAHARHLIRESRRIPAGEPAVGEALRSSFAFARQRSNAGSAVLENKASLLALGVLLGHRRLQTLVGRVVEPQDWRAIGPALRNPRMRGRNDWTRHFFVSAALTVLSAESVSDAAGLFKEELDADGGSGFSFADLLADRSGTCFALAATRDEAAARAMQQRLAAGIRVEELLPPGGDLPEGLTDVDLDRDYGGVGGAAYRGLTNQIESRLPWCGR
jgi:hypothetical protein